MKVRLTVESGAQLRTRDGTVVGQLESVTVNLDLAALRGEGRGEPTEGGRVGLESEAVLEGLQNPEGGTGETQTALLADPVDETWEVYVRALDRPKAVLTPKVRKWITDAHKAVGADLTRQAILGLGASDYHREHGYVGIEYAIVPKRGETIEGRVEKMTARAKATTDSPAANGPITVEQFTERVAPENRHRVQSKLIEPIEAALRAGATPEEGLARSMPGEPESFIMARLSLKHFKDLGFQPVIEDKRIVGLEAIR